MQAMSSKLLTFAVCLLTFALPIGAQTADAKGLFAAHCAPCHGPNGDGGKGATLAVPRLHKAPDDVVLADVIIRGIPGTEMPPTRLTLAELKAMVEYVRGLGRIAPTPVPGNAARGEKVFWGKGNCGECHAVGQRGGRSGPALSDIGARRSPAYLRTAVLDPEAGVPDNFTLYRKITFMPDNFLQVRVTTRDGRQITGVRLNEDSFSIQIRDLSDRLHSFWKSELKELHKDWGKSPMPSYKGLLTAEELQDVVAYMVSLRGAP